MNPTRLLEALTGGDERAADQLLPEVYEELRRLAQSFLNRERSDHTLQATALVHEAYLKLIDQTRVDWQGQTHFKAVAAQAMRRILVDHARSHARHKRGGDWRRLALDDAYLLVDGPEVDVLALHDALEKMRRLDERQARVVELRLFGGCTPEETARLLDMAKRTVERDWKMGRTWLRRELAEERLSDDEDE
ncbi:MAG: ECF-type sigma factor [Planctomycetota bacterium]